MNINPLLVPSGKDPVILDLASCSQEIDYAWIQRVRLNALVENRGFFFVSAPALLKKDGHLYKIPEKVRKDQARRAGLNFEALDREFVEYFFLRLSRSAFRSRFRLSKEDRAYIQKKGLDTIAKHAIGFIETRLAPAECKNDGKQTPMKGHPAFKAAHATGSCCRSCLEKWHHIPKGRALSQQQILAIAIIQLEWIKRQLKQVS